MYSKLVLALLVM